MSGRSFAIVAALATIAVPAAVFAQGREVAVVASDYKFEAPDTISSGLTTFKLVNKGTELHHMQLVRLDSGKTFADVPAALAAQGPPPKWLTLLGGPNAN